jgi:hypothetical protein
MQFPTLATVVALASAAAAVPFGPGLPITHELDELHKRANENKLTQLQAKYADMAPRSTASCTIESIAIRQELYEPRFSFSFGIKTHYNHKLMW